MNNQSKQMVIDAIIKVISAAPNPYSYNNYYYGYFQTYQSSDVSEQQFNTWINYVNQVLDISYQHIGLNVILLTQGKLVRLSSQRISYVQRIEQINQELLKLTQTILQYG